MTNMLKENDKREVSLSGGTVNGAIINSNRLT
jgi:hypothetical protein